MKRNRRRLTIAVTPQTLYHLQTLDDACTHGDVGRVVDKLVQEHQVAAKIKTEREELFYVRK